MPFGKSHEIILGIASRGVWAYFSEAKIIGSENVPETGPVILACTHHAMAVDAAFCNPIAKFVLTNSGVLPVDRKNKDNQVLFRATFEALAQGEIVGVFPEGTSYTEPQIVQVKDGVAWSALEYMKWNRLKKEKGEKTHPDAVVIPVGIVYTEKSRYRSGVIVEFGKPITVDQYEAQFLSDEEGAPRACAKDLTKRIKSQMLSLTINAPDWDTLYSAKMARSLLWPRARSLSLDDFVPVSQVLIDAFSDPDSSPLFESTKKALLTYYSLLESSKLTHEALADLPLPRTLDPSVDTPLPSRLSTLAVLLKDTIATTIRLPFFVLPALIHIPAYILCRLLARMVEEEEESQAQMKIFGGIFAMAIMTYPVIFLFLWAFLWLTPVGALLAAGLVWLLAVYHVSIIDDNYEQSWDLSRAAVEPWTKPRERPANEWIMPASVDTNPPVTKVKQDEAGGVPKVVPPKPTSIHPKGKKRPASRGLIRHVLRARLHASRALASYLEELQRSDSLLPATQRIAQLDVGLSSKLGDGEDIPRRHAHAVINYLRGKGAKISQLSHDDSSDWAALNSDGEFDTPYEERSEDTLTWVPPQSSRN
ncbi:Phosphate acyltransferase [Rhizoctonia solani]|uniref:Phosphate acyltransferase n=1 Tax=Rhizoctonia solani TaxID=456999 RepID=A0A8H7M6G5_9AGAM|nr:Phosphate acyltransferase [Rhizoctonia solani]